MAASLLHPSNGEYPDIRVGVAGTGYVARHFISAFDGREGLRISGVLTRRLVDSLGDFPRLDLVTKNAAELAENADVVFECSCDPIHAATVVAAACEAGRPGVTMNAEFHTTAGSFFADKGVLTEARGDQPGSLAALHQRALNLQFKPLAYVNMKAFMKLDPTPEEMQYWADRKSVSVDKIISFTDGTKLQIEQALVANGLGATIATPGMHGLQTPDLDEAARFYGDRVKQLGAKISDYILFPDAPHGVFIVAEHDDEQHGFLTHIKMGDGPYYVLTDHEVLVHLEVARTIQHVVRDGRVLLNNSSRPRINVAAVAKHPLAAGERIAKAIGSFEMRGLAVTVEAEPDAVPIGLIEDAVLKRAVEPGQIVTFDDVELPETLARRCWLRTKAALEQNTMKEEHATSPNERGASFAELRPPTRTW